MTSKDNRKFNVRFYICFINSWEQTNIYLNVNATLMVAKKQYLKTFDSSGAETNGSNSLQLCSWS